MKRIGGVVLAVLLATLATALANPSAARAGAPVWPNAAYFTIVNETPDLGGIDARLRVGTYDAALATNLGPGAVAPRTLAPVGRGQLVVRLAGRWGRTLHRTVALRAGHAYCAFVHVAGNRPAMFLVDGTATGAAAEGCGRHLGLGWVDVAAVRAVRQALARDLEVPADQVAVVRYASVVWPNSRLGCGDLAVYHLPVLVPGYAVILWAGGTEAEYHTNDAPRAEAVSYVRCR